MPPSYSFLFQQAQNDSCLQKMMKTMEEIKDSMEARKEFKKLKELFQCVICKSTCAASMYFCITGCGQLIGCFLCVSKIEDCPLCRLSLPDVQIRKPMFVSGLATLLDIPEISMRSALREANLLSSPLMMILMIMKYSLVQFALPYILFIFIKFM